MIFAGRGDRLDLAPAQRQRPPRLRKSVIDRAQELVDVAADHAVDVLSRPSRPRQSVLQVGAALEDEPRTAIGIDRTLKRGNHDRGGDEPSQLGLLETNFLLRVGDPGVEDAR